MILSMPEETAQSNEKDKAKEIHSPEQNIPPPPPLPIQLRSEELKPTASAIVAALRKEYQPVKWKRLNPVLKYGGAVLPRQGHRAVAYKHLMIMFSGGNECLFEDLNVYNTITNEWTQPTVRGHIPPGKAAYGAAIDGHRILVFGGMEERGYFSDSLFELNVQKWEWTLLRPVARTLEEKPCARIGHSFNLIKDKIYMFGGLTNYIGEEYRSCPNYLNELHVLLVRTNMQHGIWEVPSTFGKTPLPRESHTAVSYVSKDSRHNKLVIFGGMLGIRLGDLHTLDIDTMMWSQIRTKGTLPRSLHTATLVGEKVYIFGGWVPLCPANERVKWDEDYEAYKLPWGVTNQLHCLNVRTMNWENVRHIGEGEDAETPVARAGHSAVTINNRIYMWSGRDGYKRSLDGRQICLGDLWMLDVEKPGVPAKAKLLNALHDSLAIEWPHVPGADGYILQCMIFEMPEGDVPPSSTAVTLMGSLPSVGLPSSVGPLSVAPRLSNELGPSVGPPFSGELRPSVGSPFSVGPRLSNELRPSVGPRFSNELCTSVGPRLSNELRLPAGPRPSNELRLPVGSRPSNELRLPAGARFSNELRLPAGPRPSNELRLPSGPRPSNELRLPAGPRPSNELRLSAGPSPSNELRLPSGPRPSNELRLSVGPLPSMSSAGHPQCYQIIPQRPGNYIRFMTPGQPHVRQQGPQRLTLTGHGIPGTTSFSGSRSFPVPLNIQGYPNLPFTIRYDSHPLPLTPQNRSFPMPASSQPQQQLQQNNALGENTQAPAQR